jgi:cysteine desulfurase
MIYFDSAASYPILPEALTELQKGFITHFANPSSAHKAGEAAAKEIELAREIIADAIGALPSEIVFTSGATESNNLAIKSHFYEPANREKRHLLISSIEHKCVHAVADYLQRKANVSVSVVQPNKRGVITREDVEKALRYDTSLVSVMHLNNELGTMNPIDEIGALCFERGIKLHSDAAQSFLKLPINVDDMNVDYLSISAHKVGGPKGIGAVYIRARRTRDIEPLVHGAGQEEGLRGGTLPTPLISSFGKAVKSFPSAYETLRAAKLKQLLLEKLTGFGVAYKVNGDSIDSLVSLTLPECDVSALMRETADRFSLATGSACSSKEIEASHVLMAIGLGRELAEKTVRVSFSHLLQPSHIEQLAEQIAKWDNVN